MPPQVLLLEEVGVPGSTGSQMQEVGISENAPPSVHRNFRWDPSYSATQWQKEMWKGGNFIRDGGQSHDMFQIKYYKYKLGMLCLHQTIISTHKSQTTKHYSSPWAIA